MNKDTCMAVDPPDVVAFRLIDEQLDNEHQQHFAIVLVILRRFMLAAEAKGRGKPLSAWTDAEIIQFATNVYL